MRLKKDVIREEVIFFSFVSTLCMLNVLRLNNLSY